MRAHGVLPRAVRAAATLREPLAPGYRPRAAATVANRHERGRNDPLPPWCLAEGQGSPQFRRAVAGQQRDVRVALGRIVR